MQRFLALFTLLGTTFASAHKCGRHGHRCATSAAAEQWPFDHAIWQLMDPAAYMANSLFRESEAPAAYHIAESPTEYRMEVPLPGVDSSSISLDVTTDIKNDRVLKLTCDHKRPTPTSAACSQEWRLARDVDDSARIEAHYSDGLLEVVAPKRTAMPDPTKINVTGRSTSPTNRIAPSSSGAPVEDRSQVDSRSQLRWREVQAATSQLREKVKQLKDGDMRDMRDTTATAGPTTTATATAAAATATTAESTVDHFIPSAAPAEDTAVAAAPEDTPEEVVDLDDIHEAATAALSHPGQPL